MTRASKKGITRQTDAAVYETGKMRPIMVTVMPKTIVFRAKGMGNRYELGIERLFMLAVMSSVDTKKGR